MRRLLGIWLIGLALVGIADEARADTLDRAKKAGVLTLGFRHDAAPFSFVGGDGQPTGYSVELCRRIADAVAKATGRADLNVKYRRVTAQDRFEALRTNKIDLLCEGTTVTLSRREHVDFTLLTFLSGASLMVRTASPVQRFGQLRGRKVGVLAGTTTEAGLRSSLRSNGIEAAVTTVASHDDGLKALQDGAIDAYFADRELLVGLAARSGGGGLLVADEYLSYEPYALALRRNDNRFRLLADRAIADLYRTGAIEGVFARSFAGAAPSPMLKSMYIIQALPE